jgi:hypothetical protein
MRECRYILASAASIAALCGGANPAFAQAANQPAAAEPQAPEAPAVDDPAGDVPPARWRITVTPRLQYLLFLPNANADALEGLVSAGASIAARSPDGRLGITATYLYGRGSGTYNFHDGARSGTFDYAGNRREMALLGELNPAETNVTLIAGYHRFSARAREALLNGGADHEVNDYHFSIDAAEFGLRLASRLTAQSRHAVSAQFSAGIGSGHFRANEDRLLAGVPRIRHRDESGFGYIGDIALGYNYFLTDRLTIGTRGRGYLFYVQAQGAYPIFAVTPEINFSFRF